MNKFVVTFGVLMSLVVLSCGRKESTDADAVADAESLQHEVGSALLTLGDAADEQAGEAVAKASHSFELIPSAMAADCSLRAGQAICNNGLRSVTYSGCTIPNTPLALNGSVILDYSQNDCSMSQTGDSFTRTFQDLVRESWVGGNVAISSDNHQDYRGQSLGGGARVEKTAGGWELDVLGTRRVHDRGYFDFSIRTTSPVVITGSLARVGRTVASGEIEVIHNKAKFVTTLSPHGLAYQAGCCHPVGGRLDIELSGSRKGSGSVTFTGCGRARVERDGKARDVELRECL